jgi:hypothetical protein
MLPRALDFRLGDARLTIEARGRRAIRATKLDPAGAPGAETLASLAAGGHSAEQERALLARLVHEFAAGAGSLTVAARASTLPPSIVDKGHAPAELAAVLPELAPEAEEAPEEAAGKAPADTPTVPQEPPAAKAAGPAAGPPAPEGASPGGRVDGVAALKAFQDRASGFARSSAFAGRGGQVEAQQGSGAALRLTRRLGAEGGLPGPWLDAALAGPKLVVLGGRAEEPAELCLAAQDGAAAVVEITPSHLDAAVNAWRAGVRRARG